MWFPDDKSVGSGQDRLDDSRDVPEMFPLAAIC